MVATEGERTSGTDDERARRQVATGLALLATGLLAVALLAAGVWWWVAFPIGGGLIPLAQGLAMRSEADEWKGSARGGSDDRQDAPDELRSRCARGELTDAEFESRLERLPETGTVEDARESLHRDRARERERDVE